MLLLLGLPGLCFWGLGLPFVVGGIIMMVVGGRSAQPQQFAPQQNYQQVYYPPPAPPGQQQPRALGASPAQPQSYPQQPPGVYGQPQYPQQPHHPDERW